MVLGIDHVGHRPVRRVRGVRAPPAAERRDRRRIVLLASMSSTFREELPYLVVFTGAALFLLIQMHAFDERATWIRRRIGDPSTISSLYLRGGTVFILAAMLGSLLLTTARRVEPAGGRVGTGPRPAHRGGETLGRFLPVGGDARARGVDLRGRGQDRAPSGSGRRLAFTAVLPARRRRTTALLARRHLRHLHPRRMGPDDTRRRRRRGRQPSSSPAARTSRPGDPRKVRVTIRPEDFHGNDLLRRARRPAWTSRPGAPDRRGRLVHRGRGAAGHRRVHGRQRRARARRRHEDQRQPARPRPRRSIRRTSRTCTRPSRPTRSARRREPSWTRSRRRRSRATRTTSPRRSSRSSATSPSTTTTRT